MTTRWVFGLVSVIGLCGPLARAQEPPPAFEDDFAAGHARWQSYLSAAKWSDADGVLRVACKGDSALLAKSITAADAVIETTARVAARGRANFGVVLRAKEGRSCLMLRYYDHLDALQLLRFTANGTEVIAAASRKLGLARGKWYHFRALVAGDTVLGKIWAGDTPEPDWQIEGTTSYLDGGQVGITVQESTVEFQSVRIWTGKAATKLVHDREADKAERERRFQESLTLRAEATPHFVWMPDGPARRIDVLPVAGEVPYPVDGVLTVTVGDDRQTHDVKAAWFSGGPYPLLVPEPAAPVAVSLAFKTSAGKTLESRFTLKPSGKGLAGLRSGDGVPAKRYRDYVVRCLDTLMKHGTDRYGPVKTPMFMAILDVRTLESPESPPMLDGMVRTEERPSHGRRSPGGSNLWHDMVTLRTMYRVAQITGESKYAEAADAYIKAAYEHARKPNDMLAWGSHIYYHAFKDRPGGDQDGRGPHEILIKHPDWAAMYRVNPDATRKEVDGIWKWHVVDKKTGLHNRHDDGRKGCDFAFSGGSFAIAFTSMYLATEEEHYLDKAKLVAGWHWQNRKTDTGLVADSPGLGNRYDANHCFTTVTGPHASQLLRCYELTGETFFRNAAVSYIKAYERYGWDDEAGTYHAMLLLNGTPVPDRSRGAGYSQWSPYGHVDVWRTVMYSYEFPLIAAQAAVYAYELSGEDKASRDPALLRIATHWGQVIEKNLPPQTGRRWRAEIERTLPKVRETGGTYAENYGRAISFFVSLYHATDEVWYQNRARLLADEAIEKLYVNGLFRGHPAKDYYQANDGVGFLLHALMQLDALPDNWRLAF